MDRNVIVNNVVVDLDDFREETGPRDLDRLDLLKSKVPGLKVTLFTIPGLCSIDFLKRAIETRPWLELVPHGWFHSTSRECQDWDARTSDRFFHWLFNFQKALPKPPLAHGFKAPGWQMSDELMRYCCQQSIWIADQHYNDERRPYGTRVYFVDGSYRIHGHLGHLGGHNANELQILEPEIIARRNDSTFSFCSENLITWRRST